MLEDHTSVKATNSTTTSTSRNNRQGEAKGQKPGMDRGNFHQEGLTRDKRSQQGRRKNRHRKRRAKGNVGGDRDLATASSASDGISSESGGRLFASSHRQKHNQKHKSNAQLPKQEQQHQHHERHHRFKGDQQQKARQTTTTIHRKIDPAISLAAAECQRPCARDGQAQTKTDKGENDRSNGAPSSTANEKKFGECSTRTDRNNEEYTSREKDIVNDRETTTVRESIARLADRAVNVVAPFECSWATTPGGGAPINSPKNMSHGKHHTTRSREENSLATSKIKEPDGGNNEGSCPTFQEGEDSELELYIEDPKVAASLTTELCSPTVDEQAHSSTSEVTRALQADGVGENVVHQAREDFSITSPADNPLKDLRSTLSSNESHGFVSTKKYDGRHKNEEGATAQDTPGDATMSRHHPKAEVEGTNDGVGDEMIPEDDGDAASPHPTAKSHSDSRDRAQKQGSPRQGHNGSQGQERSERQDVLPDVMQYPPQSAPTQHDAGEEACLLHDDGDSLDEKLKCTDHNDVGQGKPQRGEGAKRVMEVAQRLLRRATFARNNEKTELQAAAQQKACGKGSSEENPSSIAVEDLVDDVDDEASSLLDSSPSIAPSLMKSATKPTPTHMPGAAAEESSMSTSVLSTPSPSGIAAASSSAEMEASSPAPNQATAEGTIRGSSKGEATDSAKESFSYNELPLARDKDPASLGGIWAAVRRGDVDAVRTKLAAGATIDEADSEGRTPLMVACATGDTDMATFLINGVSPPASVAARTIQGWTPLMIASGGGRLGVVKVLIQAGAALHDEDDEFGSNSFMWACGGGHAGVVKLMLDSGGKELLRSTKSEMWTALMVACDAGSLETVQVLVEAGTDLDAFNSDGMTALDIATDRNNLLVECYLRTERAASSSQFWTAADSGNTEMMSRLLKSNGHLVATLDTDGRTALLRACVGGHLGIARILIEAGADVDFQDSSGTSALSIAVVLGDMKLTRYLIQAGGARQKVKNNMGWTPLMQAVVKGDLTMTRYLVDRGAVVNDGSPGGESVLDMARRFSSPEMQRYLSAKGGFSSHEVKRQIGEVEGGGRGLFRFW